MSTEDPREYGLTAADLRTAADRLYPPGDPRLDPVAHTHEVAVPFGRIRTRLRGLADAIDPKQDTAAARDADERAAAHEAALTAIALVEARMRDDRERAMTLSGALEREEMPHVITELVNIATALAACVDGAEGSLAGFRSLLIAGADS
jgi:hypothetical protein